MVTRALYELEAVHQPGSAEEPARQGEVFTRQWVVDLILDLLEYTPDRKLFDLRLVEPACGTGAFLESIVRRLSASCRNHGRSIVEAADAVAAFDLLPRNVQASRRRVAEALRSAGWPSADIDEVVGAWIHQRDYLLAEHRPDSADLVVGNPPYIRLEDLPDARMAAYRANCTTMGGRADVYVGFYEMGLRSLKSGGRLGFICADRWMRNQYGQKLRQFVSSGYHVELVAAMHDVDAFHDAVSAYPAVTLIRRAPQGPAIVADTTRLFGRAEAEHLKAWAKESGSTAIARPTFHAARLPHWFAGEESWPTGSPARLAVLEDLNDRFGFLESPSTGTRVGIGVATGADRVFLTQEDDLVDVEADRLLPMAMARDTSTGTLTWHGTYLVNPWNSEGSLVDLGDHPRLARYLARHRAVLCRRYVATKQPDKWYKTIDKIDHTLVNKPKLLFPDLKATMHPVLDEGGLYPHHNLYYITSDTWDLRVLGGLLLSRVAEIFMSAYAVRMRGGTLRFQAQYLRRIRVPDPSAISTADRVDLADAFARRDREAATRAALRVYGLAGLPAPEMWS